MSNLKPEQIEKLQAPLPKGAISPHPTKSYLSTIKAIYVVERMNEVFGIGCWHISYEEIPTTEVEGGNKQVVVKGTLHAEGIAPIEQYGGNDNKDLGDAYKGAATDALTKIASYLGIGMDVYKGLGDKTNDDIQMGEEDYKQPEVKPKFKI